MHGARAVVLTSAVCVCGLAFGVPSAFAGGTFTWSGTDSSTAYWSAGDNWLGGSAPTASDSGDALVFPAALSGGDCATTQDDACYVSEDDLPGYAISGLTIDDGSDDYYLAPDGANDSLTLGGDGITATTSSAGSGGAEIGIPLVLDSGQDWTIDGGSAGTGQLLLDDGLAATNTNLDDLDIDFSNAGLLELSGDNEVGPVTASGSDGSNFGLDAFANGAIELSSTSLDASDDNPVAIRYAGIFGSGTVGPLTADAGAVEPGDPTGVMSVDGDVSFGNASDFTPLILDSGTTAGTDYSQLTATGNVNLTDTNLEIQSGDASGVCPTYRIGSVYTLVSATGTITGTFSNASINGVELTLDCIGQQPIMTIAYSTHAVTATVIGPEYPTTTTLSASSFPPYPDQQVTLTATVTATSGTPSGTIEFESESGTTPVSGIFMVNGSPVTVQEPVFSPVPGCTSVPLVAVGSSYEATCTTTTGAAGSTAAYKAVFSPATGVALDSSVGLSSPSPIAAPPLSTVIAYRPSTKGDALSLPVTCQGPSQGNSCTITVALNVNETLRDGKIIAIAAKAKVKKVKRTVTIGTKTLTVNAGVTQTLTLTLNAAGQVLLKSHHELSAKLTISGTSALPTQTITFKEPTKKRSRNS